MRIGLFTLPLNHNYGGSLQCYALMTVLKRLGHSVVYINRRNKENRIRSVYKKVVFSLIYRKSNNFIRDYITPKTECFTTFSELREAIPCYGFDACIVGSDQVWRMDYMRGYEKEAFLTFIQNDHTRKIAYAASFGLDIWNGDSKSTHMAKNALATFSAISTREVSGCTILKTQFQLDNCNLVLDPTLLLKKEDYINLVQERGKKPKGNLLVYVLDTNKEKRDFIAKLSTHYGLTPFFVNARQYRKTLNPFYLYKMCFKPIEDWIMGFYHADYVITDSYHGTVFSILFNKQFLTIGNTERGLSRFDSLLSVYNLGHRLVTDMSVESEYLLMSNIDYDKVNSILDNERDKSIVFLTQNLGNRT